MASVSLGAGAFVQPKVVARVGYMQGVLIIVFFGIITNYAQILLLLVLNAKERRSVDEEKPKHSQHAPLMNTVGGTVGGTGSSDDPKYASYSEVSYDVLGNTGLILSCFTMSISCLVANAGQLATATQMLHDLLCWYFTGSFDYPFSRDAVWNAYFHRSTHIAFLY